MADLSADFEAGTLSSTILTSDPGSATAWDLASAGTGGTLIYDNTHVSTIGVQAAKIAIGGTSGTTFLGWTTNFVDQSGTHYCRLYYYATANPAPTNILILGRDDTPTALWRVQINTTGKIELCDSAGTIRATSTNSVSLNQWVRIECKFVQSATVGQIECQLFNSPDSATPTETFATTASWNIGATCKQMLFGIITATTNRTIWLDNIVASPTDYPGPAVVTGAAWNKVITQNFTPEFDIIEYGSRFYSGSGNAPTDWTVSPDTGTIFPRVINPYYY